MNAVARIRMWGHSLAVRILPHLAREPRTVDGTSAQLSVESGCLVVEPIDAHPVYDVKALIEAIPDENRHIEVGTGHAQGDEFA